MAMFLRNMDARFSRVGFMSGGIAERGDQGIMSIYRDTERLPGKPLWFARHVTKKRVAIVIGHLLMIPAGAHVLTHYGWRPWIVALVYIVGLRLSGYIEGIEEGRERWKSKR